jgi:hypothetical protein
MWITLNPVFNLEYINFSYSNTELMKTTLFQLLRKHTKVKESMF